MKIRTILFATLFLTAALPWRFPAGLSVNGPALNDAEAYYGSYSAGEVQGTGSTTTRGSAYLDGSYVTYYTDLPGSCIHLVSQGQSYYNCDGTYFRPYYLGNQIVYVQENP